MTLSAPTSEAVTPAAIRRAVARARAGKALDRPEAVALLSSRGPDLEQLASIAAAMRDQGLADAGRPGVITYSRKVFIPLTRLCRDRCHYCTFATTPKRVPTPFLSPDEVLEIARAGAAAGCKEALFTLGDRPEDRWPAAAEWLASRGYEDTLAYVRAMAILVLEETGLLPHLNPGVMSWEELQRLKPVAPSMGMMLETTSTELWSKPGGCHYGSPDKDPTVRLRVLEDASRSAIPFTTGLLIGIGETLADRAHSLFELRRIARQFCAIQEVIIQNFRAKPDTAMRTTPDAEFEEYLAAVATARIILGPRMRIQAPPNLTDAHELARLVKSGVDDWGGVSPLTPDHVNPERPWPHLDTLAELTAAAGFTLRERLTAQPEYVLAGEPWIDPRVAEHLQALADPDTGLARTDAQPVGRPWQEADTSWESTGRVDLHTAIDNEGRHTDARSDFDHAFGDWAALREQIDANTGARHHVASPVAEALRAAERNPATLTDDQALALMSTEGTDLDLVCALADHLRRETVGDEVTYIVNRNINFTNVCYTGCRFCAFAQRRSDDDAYTLSLDEVARRAEQAWALGATEVCMQGGIDPQLPGTFYFDLVREIKRRTPDMHVHAFSPMEVLNGATKLGIPVRDWLVEAKAAGLGTIPGTAAEILDDEIRWVLTKGKLPTSSWIEVVRTAHQLGIRSSSTMMFGHVDQPHHWVAHLKLLRQLQAETGGFTEFVPLPFVHQNAPLYLAGVSRPGPTVRDTRAVHAVARIMLHGLIDNIQCSWVKLGADGCADLLNQGVNDLGGTLMEETISRMAGSAFGSYQTPTDLEAIAARAGRPARQRLTTYQPAPEERRNASHAFTGHALKQPPLLTTTRSTCG